MATTRPIPSPLFGRMPDARQAVREVSNDLIATIKAMRTPREVGQSGVQASRRHDFPMRLLAAIVQAHISTDCVVGRAVPVPSVDR